MAFKNKAEEEYYKSKKAKFDKDYEEMRKDEVTEEEVNSWLKQAQETATNFKAGDTSKYTTTYGSDTSSKAKNLLANADKVWKYLYNHKDEYKDADKLRNQFGALRSGLTRINSHIDGVNEYYSQWETEGDYFGHIMTNTGDKTDNDSVKKRQNAYTSVNNRIKQIDDEIAGLDVSDGYTTNEDGIMVKAPRTGKDVNRYDKLVAEKERLQTYVRKYERGNKDKDALFLENATKEDYEEKSANRDFGNPTVDDFNEFDTYAYGGYIVNYDTGEETRVEPSLDYDIEGEEAKLAINDPLGFYFDNLGRYAELGENTYFQPDAVTKGVDGQQILLQGDANHWSNLKDDEVQMYYYLLNDQGQESAMSFLEGLESELNYRETEDYKEYIAEASVMEKIFHNVISIPANIIGGGVAAVGDVYSLITTGEVDPYSDAHNMKNYADATRGVTAEEFNEMTNGGEFLGMTAGDAYQALMSGADSFVGANVFGPAYMGFMVAGAASSGVKDLYESGASTGQIISGAFINGAAEWLGEKIPLDGVVLMGDSMVDTRALTGESVPRSVHPMDEVLSGCINESGALTIQVTKLYKDSTVAKIIDNHVLEDRDSIVWAYTCDMGKDLGKQI